VGGAAIQIDGAVYGDDLDIPSSRLVRVSPGFFATFGIAPLEGRVFTGLDGGDAPPVAIVNQSFVQEHFPDGVALGRRIRAGLLATANPWREIVGVVPDVGIQRLGIEDQDSPAGLYVPVAQDAVPLSALVVRAQGDPLALTRAVRDAVVAIDPDTPIYAVYSLRGRIDEELWFYGVFGGLFAVFGAAALFMATIGLYGVMSFSVSRRTQEMGIRMALGAQARQVRALVLRQGMTQIAFGTVIGTGLALLVSRGLEVFLLGGRTWDPVTYLLVFAVLAVTGLLASSIPAARATRVDPADALRAG
jgi:predicted lysophospholipase L1 biosynthesis ABC-type transport system permease subunit